MTTPQTPRARWINSLSPRLFAITILAILIIEAILFVPSAANFRNNWLQDRVEASRIAALALDAAPMRNVSQELSARLLEHAEVIAVAETEDEMRTQLLAPAEPFVDEMKMLDLRSQTRLQSWRNALGTLTAPSDRLLVISDVGSTKDRVIEVVVPQAPLKRELVSYAWRVAGLSLIIALAAGSLIWYLFYRFVVVPVRRVTTSVEQFSQDPGSWSRRLRPTRRRDEIGRAQNALSGMEEAVAGSFRQQQRLADLGEAVAKINHDLRNSLASAQLVSDTLKRSEDPRVMRAAPRLERALERAIKLTTATLEYGKADGPDAQIETMNLHAALDEAAQEALARFETVSWTNDVPTELNVLADHDHLHRIAANLIRNAAQAMNETGGSMYARMNGNTLELADTGPGLPQKAQDNLFKPFAGSARRDGTGLGLAISQDLAEAIGANLSLQSTGPEGTVFALTFAKK